ncbi:NupC/NupG family nucleoside CNT transporter [Moritella viscosa]|uniref:Nucleoside permease n=2 Tax=Moritella viscosa TaxID=80854 RepID=A0ABY1HET9_9GAMM|nr:NupC/NupG family nucleoside CNT transporter [Moritella viscosa]SGY90406.1 Nucleoside permease NupC [Moritella viscosa]SGY94321.1 Nucleoside permease NupC [Moritella viscosa]SGY94699.1 Nucleoside permease NupC [Moritella viscosa]SGY99525.1 Nucleoside permease NupC [Moritella viscosa]SHO26019.1 Nucleoside permease NupC [Moritella viscosa]
MNFVMGIVGVFVLLGLAVLLSDNRKAINLRTVGGAFAIQVAIGAFILYFPPGKELLQGLSTGVANVIAYGNEGIQFLFGDLAKFKVGFIFAINVLPVIVFFSSLIAVLYYIGVMSVVINFIGGGLQKLLGTSRSESLSATANIFVGQTEAPLVVRPFIKSMTKSELFAVMVGGLASIAGSVLAGYAGLGIKIEYLVAASFMAAPGGLLMAKIIKPETDTPKITLDDLDDSEDEKPANVLDAAAAGASSGMMLALNVGAMLIAFVGLIALANGITGGIGAWFDMPELTIQMILGWVFSPLAFVIGVPWHEAVAAGSFIGQKLVVNEFVAFLDFVNYIKNNELSEHTQIIISFALCGFANFSSIAILLGGLGSLAPTRRADIASMGLKAVLAASLANLMSAALAGLFLV